jgi:hypothetical protein
LFVAGIPVAGADRLNSFGAFGSDENWSAAEGVGDSRLPEQNRKAESGERKGKFELTGLVEAIPFAPPQPFNLPQDQNAF